MKKQNSTKKSLIQYAIFGLIAIILYATGLHTEVIGFAQRGLLETGLMNPDIEQEDRVASLEGGNESLKEVSKNPDASYDLNLKDENGNLISLSQFEGKVIFMNFWATWCPPCVAEMPAINKLHNDLGDEVVFVMLSMDNDFEKAISYKNRKEYGLPVYTQVGPMPQIYHSSALPTTFVIDTKGKLVLTHKGMADYDTKEFRNFLKSL
ncbi:TlpA disulfide reductase family protein [Gramella sp. KN1008]|uniref:TlpA family protein disulfide reductase n=1 Tax=Gramella sp. KN1008 TaxID=2529298 RepID=UPI00103B9CBB|nr:TlpA disulfide reductase family protein [Gramella sp. KN1008]TBW26395.1 TlpA family protein disulfide reductase [Gramella sp. KN1008]